MRVLYHHRTQGRGAEAVHIHSFCDGLHQLGFETTIVGPPGVNTDPNAPQAADVGKPKTALGWIARNIPQAGFELMEIAYNLNARPRLASAISQNKPAFVYERYALYNLAGVLSARKAGIPFVLEMNDTVYMDRQRQGKKLTMKGLAAKFENRLLNLADGIVVVSGYLKQHLVDRGIPANKVLVTPNAVHEHEFDPEHIKGDSIRAKYGLGDAVVVGFAGSFAKWHRVDLLVAAAASLKDKHPNLKLLLIGDGAERAAAEQQAKDLGFADRVVFTGKIPHAAIPEHVAAMDIGVMPESNLFGSPMKIFEYMAMGVTPVGPRYIPLEEAIDHNLNGLIFEPGKVDALAASLDRLLSDPEERLQMGRAAREKVLTRHLWVHNAQAVVDLLASNGRPVK